MAFSSESARSMRRETATPREMLAQRSRARMKGFLGEIEVPGEANRGARERGREGGREGEGGRVRGREGGREGDTERERTDSGDGPHTRAWVQVCRQ